MIIEIEGIDGSGKETQASLLYNALKKENFKCLKLSFPNYDSPSCYPVKEYLSGNIGKAHPINGNQASILFMTDRLATMSNINVEEYDFIIMDRYVGSNIIHQSLDFSTTDELYNYIAWLNNLEYNVLQLPRADLVLFLDLPVEESIRLMHERMILKNGQSHDILEEDNSHLYRAHARAVEVAKILNWHMINCFDNKVREIHDIHKEILSTVHEFCNLKKFN